MKSIWDIRKLVSWLVRDVRWGNYNDILCQGETETQLVIFEIMLFGFFIQDAGMLRKFWLLWAAEQIAEKETSYNK